MYPGPAKYEKFIRETWRCVYRFAWAAAAGDLGLNVASTTPETFRAAVLAAQGTTLSHELITLARQAFIHLRDWQYVNKAELVILGNDPDTVKVGSVSVIFSLDPISIIEFLFQS